MAEVYRAYHPFLDRFVAIKVLHSFLADDPEFKSRFEREARNIARLRHSNIVQVYDFETDVETESFYMVMELIDGLTLKEHLFRLAERGELLPFGEALRITREAAGALAYAHSQDMIHRDVKPANLMLDHDKRVVLTDFGIAKIVTNLQFTASGGMVGTPAYMAPEQGLGEAGDERSDLYSLGVILFQMVTGQLPYEAETPLAVILKHLNDPVPSARRVNPEVPEEVDGIIMRLMAKDPDNRHQSANELIEDLRKVETGQPIEFREQSRTVPPAVERGTGSSGSSGRIIIQEDHTPTMDRPLAVKGRPGDGAPAADRVAPRRRFPVWLGVLLLAGMIIGGIAVIALASPDRSLLALLGGSTETPTTTVTPAATDTPAPTDTPTTEPTATETSTPTETITLTATSSGSPTLTATRTPTYTPSVTLTPSRTPSPTITLTPSPDVTLTLIQATLLMDMQTATMAACDFDFRIVSQTPADADFFQTNRAYTRELTLLNTGTCPWERNSALSFVSGENFNFGPRVLIRDRINVGERVSLTLSGRTPTSGGLLTGVWELRTPGQIPIGEPLQISINVFEG